MGDTSGEPKHAHEGTRRSEDKKISKQSERYEKREGKRQRGK